MYQVEKPFVAKKKNKHKEKLATKEDEAGMVAGSRVCEMFEASPNKEVKFTKSKKIVGIEMLTANIRLYEKGSGEQHLQNKLQVIRGGSRGSAVKRVTIPEAVEKKRYSQFTKSMERKSYKTPLELEKIKKERQHNRRLLFGFDQTIKKAKSEDVKLKREVSEDLNRMSYKSTNQADDFNRPSYKSGAFGEDYNRPSFKSSAFFDDNNRLSFKGGNPSTNQEKKETDSEHTNFHRKRTHLPSIQDYDQHRGLGENISFSHVQKRRPSVNTKIPSVSKLSAYQDDSISRIKLDEDSQLRVTGFKSNKLLKKKHLQNSQFKLGRSMIDQTSDLHIHLILSEKKINVLEITEKQLYICCYKLCKLIQECKDNEMPYHKLETIFHAVEGEEERELEKVFRNYSTASYFDPLELMRIVKVGWIRPAYLGYKLNYQLPDDDPILEIQNRRTFFLKLNELYDRLRLHSLESKNQFLEISRSFIDEGVRKIENPELVVLHNSFDLTNSYGREQVEPLDVHEIKKAFSLKHFKNKSIEKVISDFKERGIDIFLPYVNKESFEDNKLIHAFRSRLQAGD